MPDLTIAPNQNVLTINTNTTTLTLTTDAIVVAGGSGDATTLDGQTSSYYLDRSNHTGTQPQSTVTNLITDLQALNTNKLDVSDYNDRFLGLYASYFDLVAAHPTSFAGYYAQVDFGLGSDVIEYAWDVSDGQWSAVGVSAIANTDELPEGSSNLYHTTIRVRNTVISGVSASNTSAVSTADTVEQAIGKAQGQIDAINAKDGRQLLLANTVTNKSVRSSAGIGSYTVALMGMFSTNHTFAANSLSVGDTFIVEATMLYIGITGQTGSIELRPMINNTGIDAIYFSAGVSGINTGRTYNMRLHMSVISPTQLLLDGYTMSSAGATIYTMTTVAPIVLSTAFDFNIACRFTNAPPASNDLLVKQARLYKII